MALSLLCDEHIFSGFIMQDLNMPVFFITILWLIPLEKQFGKLF